MAKRMWAGALAGLVLALLPLGTSAFETVRVGEVEATRIVIAPPQTSLAGALRDGLREAIAAATPGTRAHTDAQRLYYFYGGRYFEPLWIVEDARGRLVPSPSAEAVLSVLEAAHLEGLDPDDYLTETIDIARIGTGAARLAAWETAFSGAALRYAQDAYGGRLDPRSVSPDIDIAVRQVDEAELLTDLAGSDDPATVLMALHPTHREFIALRELLARHYDGSIPEQVTIPEGRLLRFGMSDPRVPLLRERLEVEAPPELSAAEIYDDDLQIAVAEFQRRFGLTVDGVLGPATIAALNGAGGATPADIVANMERWRWMPRDLGDFNVFVNIPEFRLDVYKEGESVWDTRVIVGTTARRTPVFSDQIRHVVTNPYWNLPPTILREDIMPRVAANPGYLASQNMELLYGGRVIDAHMVDWGSANPGQFRVRQRPGRSNALGQVKFLFPNKHDVYLHDTNAPALFSRSFRAISSGCVRVEDPFEFARVLLEFEPSFTVASLENSLGGPNERWFNMDHRVPVHLAYFTLRIDEDGTIRSYADLYGHNERVISLLGL